MLISRLLDRIRPYLYSQIPVPKLSRHACLRIRTYAKRDVKVLVVHRLCTSVTRGCGILQITHSRELVHDRPTYSQVSLLNRHLFKFISHYFVLLIDRGVWKMFYKMLYHRSEHFLSFEECTALTLHNTTSSHVHLTFTLAILQLAQSHHNIYGIKLKILLSTYKEKHMHWR